MVAEKATAQTAKQSMLHRDVEIPDEFSNRIVSLC
jgi:hypothetical protein